MVKHLFLLDIATFCIVLIPLGVLSLSRWRNVAALRAQVKTLQNQVDQLAERNLLLRLNRREEALGSLAKPEALKSESADVLRLPIAPSVVGSR
jgi:hypothetical protein